jgi:hypothetical protein
MLRKINRVAIRLPNSASLFWEVVLKILWQNRHGCLYFYVALLPH